MGRQKRALWMGFPRQMIIGLGAAAAVSACTAAPAHVVLHPPVHTTTKAAVTTPAQRPSPAVATGTDAWQIPGSVSDAGTSGPALSGAVPGIAGYADHVSVLAGQPFDLYVSTTARRYVVRAFRMGYYAGGSGLLIWTSASLPGRRQPRPRVTDVRTAMWTADWSRSVRVTTAGWTAGDYLLKLTAGSSSAFVPITVRRSSAVGDVVIVNAVTTWQAYNRWGCCDLYEGADGSFATRSRAVSFDRPYAEENGAGLFLRNELPAVIDAERWGLPLDYVTDVDLHADPTLLNGARAVVLLGHDEYWSPTMRASLSAAIARGTNLASFGANAIFRRIRFASSWLGLNRVEINFKIASEDPLNGVDDHAVTANWPAPPAADPESKVLGTQYACDIGLVKRAGILADVHSWPLSATGLPAGTRLPGLIGPETDAIQTGYPTPHGLVDVMHSPASCPDGGPAYADATYFTSPSGAGVFNAGTIGWVCALGPCQPPVPTTADVALITRVVLTRFAQGPMSR